MVRYLLIIYVYSNISKTHKYSHDTGYQQQNPWLTQRPLDLQSTILKWACFVNEQQSDKYISYTSDFNISSTQTCFSGCMTFSNVVYCSLPWKFIYFLKFKILLIFFFVFAQYTFFFSLRRFANQTLYQYQLSELNLEFFWFLQFNSLYPTSLPRFSLHILDKAEKVLFCTRIDSKYHTWWYANLNTSFLKVI